MLTGGLVGYGFISENGHLPAYRAAKAKGIPLDVVAIADSSPARTARARVMYPGLRVYESHHAMLAREHHLDFVDICTPPSEHAGIAHAALERGLHVFCEKPMATTARDAASMLAHAGRVERVLFPSHNYKHAPVVKAVRRALDSGAIGSVRLVTLQTFRPTHARGAPGFLPDWRRERRFSGGGIAMDHGSHTFYLTFDWLGGYPTAVTAKASTLGPYDTEDDVSCALTFPNGMASAHLTWNAGVRKVIYNIHGTTGAVRVEDDEVEVSAMRHRGPTVTWDVERTTVSSEWTDASHVHWFESVFAEFVRAIERRQFIGRDAIDGYRSLELIEAVYESSRRGSREVALGPRANGREPVVSATVG